MRKSSNPKYAKAKKESVILKYLDEQLLRINSPKIEQVCFTDLKLSLDNSYCEVYVDCRERKKIDEVVRFLNKNSGLFRTYLAKNMSLYKVPIIRFHPDAVIDNIIKINSIFNEINKNKEKK